MTAATAGSVLNDDSGEGDERSILPPSPPPPAFSPTPLSERMLAKVNRSLLLPLLTPTGLRAVLLALVLGMALFLLVIMNLTVGGRNEQSELMMMEQFKEEEQSVEKQIDGMKAFRRKEKNESSEEEENYDTTASVADDDQERLQEEVAEPHEKDEKQQIAEDKVNQTDGKRRPQKWRQDKTPEKWRKTEKVEENGEIMGKLSEKPRNETKSEKNAPTEDAHKGLCPRTPAGLQGPIRVWQDAPDWPTLVRLYAGRNGLGPDGHGRPVSGCRARHRVAIIVPYKNRDWQLRVFLHNMLHLLAKQQLDFGIFVVEPVGNGTFNRGKLLNVGFREANRLANASSSSSWQCFIFHDVDLLPEDDRNWYACPAHGQARHMSVAVSTFGYKLPYVQIFGGIGALSRDDWLRVNGFSNDFWGWGGEDDDIAQRLKLAGIAVSRYPANIARYTMLKHGPDRANPINTCRWELLGHTDDRWRGDGLSNLRYRLRPLPSSRRHPGAAAGLFTHVRADLLEDECRAELRRAEGHRIPCLSTND